MAADPLLFYPAAPNRPPSDPAPDDPRKVKFLCSFGGQIIPRPSDGALRYAGGQTRIISVRRDAPLPEIMNKMAEVFGGHAALRYQLPDVDLDALVSVSSPEDLENMMEEYDKIAEAAPDGSAKLRVFLFSPSDLAADPASLLDLEDYSQRYVEAVNRISSDSSLRRKDSLASASSAHNSGGGINGGTSPEILSPTAAATNDSSRLFFVGAPSLPAGFPDPPALPANPPVAASNAATSRVELSPYTSQPYADPNQFQYMNSQPMGTPPGSLPISPLEIPPSQYQYAPVASRVGTEKSVPSLDSYGGRTTQLHGDPNSRAGNQLVSQLLPVPPTYLQPQNVELYGVRQVVPLPMQGQGYRLEDCYMCHKALPHAHSDTQVQEHGSATSEASTTFHSLRAEDATRLGTPNRVIAPPMTENKVAAGPFVSYGFGPIPEVRHDNEKLIVPNVVSDHSSALRPPAAMGLPSDIQASSGMFVNVPQYRREDSLQKQQQQSLVQPQPMVKQDGIVELYRNGVYPVNNVNPQATEALNLGHVPEFPSNHPGLLEGMMETLRVSPFDKSVYNEERKPTVIPNLVISKELKPEKVPLVEINHPVRPQVGGNTSFMGSGFRNPGIMQEGSYARPVDQLLASSLGFTQSQNLQPNVSSQVSTQDIFFINHETGREPMVPSKVLHAMPAYSCSINPVQTNNNTNTVPDGSWKDEASRYSKDMLGDFAAPTSIKFPFPNSIRPTQQVELFDEPILPDSLFPSQDPIKISGGTNFLPPRPIRVASRESVIAKDLSTENLSIANQGPDIALLLDDNVFYQPSNSLIKDSCREPVARGTRGSEEEQINKELQAVAEGAATAVLQSSAPPMPVFVARETKGSTSQFNIGGVIDDITSSNNATFLGDHRVEDTKSKPAENLNSGFLIGDEIGRLQIIKNSDLEELKELGSGTFGTVYHGKWRGSDVAIKRINNRCFAGKPSEQERTRADFWNEASKLSDLHHPNVVAFYGVVVDGPGGSVATVTEYMVNGSLRQALQKNDKTFDRSKRLLIAMDVAFGMEYLHSKNIVHFDLKSDNLLVNLRDPQRPICKVGDLGLSKVKCQTLISGGVRGTLPWMAPELLNGSSSLVSEKVDVFSFGVVMWEILTGKEPYADMHYGAIIGGIVSNTLRPPVPETCELDWRSLMERCWSSEPSERPSFTEIASGLRAMAASPSSKGR